MEELNYIFLNGFVVESEGAKVSALDRGLLYGDGVFETLRSYSGQVFHLDEHLDRLEKSARAIEIIHKIDRKELNEAIDLLHLVNHLDNAYIRITITRGLAGIGHLPKIKVDPTIIIIAKKLELPTKEKYKEGFSVTRASFPFGASEIKTTSRFPYQFAFSKAKAKGFDDTIFLNRDGYLLEGSNSNVFLVKEKTLMTPSLDLGILPGITREVVLRLAKGLGLKTKEAKIRYNELKKASEAFLTNTIVEIMPILSVDGIIIGNPKSRPLTTKLQKAFRKEVSNL